ncbi:hypothetical protein ACPV5U_28140 [Vibrio mediterranei]
MKLTPLRMVPTADLKTRLDNYMRTSGKTNVSEVLRELVDFALRVKAHSNGQDEQERSNRELLEKTLEFQYLNNRLLNNIFINTGELGEALTAEAKQRHLNSVEEKNAKSRELAARYIDKQSEV